jgi:small subunit ribosomal protein S4
VDIPAFEVAPGMTVALKEGMRANTLVNEALETAQGRGVPPWLELDAATYSGKVLSVPSREDIRLPIQEQLIVELYSR